MTVTENGTALAVREYPKLAALTGFSSEQINLVRQTVASGASIVEVAWYLYNANRLGLEPTLDQIYLIKYDPRQPAEIVVGINGYRALAESTGAYAGSDEPVYEYEDVGQPKRAPSKATVTVWKLVQGQRVPFTASARWEEFYPGDGKAGEQYRKRPHNQLAIRAESHALRKAFPYQAARFEPQPAPALWVEAAQSDDRLANNPERTKALAAEHVRIFGSDEDRAVEAPPAQAAPEGRAEEASLPSARRPSRTELWAENTRLGNKAAELGLQGVPTLDRRSGEDPLIAANTELAERIRAHEAQLVGEPEQEALLEA